MEIHPKLILLFHSPNSPNSSGKLPNSVILQVILGGTPDGPLVALAFKLEEGRFGQLTFLRYAMEIYVSTLTSV